MEQVLCISLGKCQFDCNTNYAHLATHSSYNPAYQVLLIVLLYNVEISKRSEMGFSKTDNTKKKCKEVKARQQSTGYLTI